MRKKVIDSFIQIAKALPKYNEENSDLSKLVSDKDNKYIYSTDENKLQILKASFDMLSVGVCKLGYNTINKLYYITVE